MYLVIPRSYRRPLSVVASIALVVVSAGVSIWTARAAPPAASLSVRATYRNPVFRRDFPDPAVLRVGGTYYAYGTTTGWEALNHLFPILQSTDLVHWRYVADAMTETPAWGVGDWWAPDVIVRRDTYYLYYVGKSLATNQHCVAVATARRPTGPFTPRRVIGCGDASGQGYIDPAPFVDTDGKAYLYISVDNPFHSISVIPLGHDLLHAAGPRRQLFMVSQPWEHGSGSAGNTVEGPFVSRHGSVYDLFYSGGAWEHNYAMGYATASSPLGPFTKYRHNPILRGTNAVTGPGGGSVVQARDGSWWLVYHGWSGGPGYDAGGVRNLRIDRLTWHGNTIAAHGPTTDVEPAPQP